MCVEFEIKSDPYVAYMFYIGGKDFWFAAACSLLTSALVSTKNFALKSVPYMKKQGRGVANILRL